MLEPVWIALTGRVGSKRWVAIQLVRMNDALTQAIRYSFVR